MDERDAIEQAYKNGFEAGVREFAERLRETKFECCGDYIIYAGNVDVIARELCGKEMSK